MHFRGYLLHFSRSKSVEEKNERRRRGGEKDPISGIGTTCRIANFSVVMGLLKVS